MINCLSIPIRLFIAFEELMVKIMCSFERVNKLPRRDLPSFGISSPEIAVSTISTSGLTWLFLLIQIQKLAEIGRAHV